MSLYSRRVVLAPAALRYEVAAQQLRTTRAAAEPLLAARKKLAVRRVAIQQSQGPLALWLFFFGLLRLIRTA